MDRDRLEELILRHLEGVTSEEEHAALEAELIHDPDAARLLRRLAEDEIRLARALGPPSPVLEPSVHRSRVVPSGLRPLLAAAALVVLAAGLWTLLPRGGGLRFVGDGLLAVPRDGDPIPALDVALGARYLARSGEVRAGDAVVRILAPSVFTVESTGRSIESGVVSLDAGHVRVETLPGSSGLTVRTPKGDLRDLGTIFEVQLNRAMEEDIMIGKVRSGSLPIFVLATVLVGQVAWKPAEGAERVITPETGPLKLADDFDLGRVSDREGLVFVRTALGERWTLAANETPLMAGDWLKATARGANAVEIVLAGGERAILGPGGLVELAEKGKLKLLSGEIEIRPSTEQQALVVEGPGGTSVTIDEPKVLRATEGDVARPGTLLVLDAEPRWLAGFKAKASTEALGSLLATVDGRPEPLTMGYHKVTVDIRDQIARTVIEESFVNATEGVLEGVFYFPLPQEASISGFGMWIGGELVEADIVEKERAREIYEEILREKRDPGLLEWTGGNIFKARVYPIPARGEKRIRIEYTQVLPKSGSSYRYVYPLRSEMLEKHPLRELRVDVRISSAEALASVQCPSHPARIQKTEHAARVELAAEEYTPRRDLEVVVETRPVGERGVVVVPHRRGDDGYFMVLLSAQGSEGRRLVRSGAPLEIVLVADTSASMTEAQVREQRLFIASLLEALGEGDRFNLLAFDVGVAWAFPSLVAATPENAAKAVDFLERRGTLGWTDLERALGEVIAGVGKSTHVVYVGDGIPSLGDADPAALAGRVRRLYRGAGSFHAVGVGSTYDLTVLGAIASLGEGSLHRTGGGKDAAAVANELLEEIASPGLRSLALEWKGIRVAGVYPERLANLPAGKEQILLGRYLPEGDELSGSLRVTGTLEGKPWSAEVPVRLAADEAGNSFVPRFWARLHLDHLLEEGSAPEVRERIIALSEDFQIITPYTSLLVLESDADRERFGVQKRLRMRGGEEFFAEGRDRAGYELAREQMLRARQWRARLREQVLALYAGMGRDLPVSRGGQGGQQWGRMMTASMIGGEDLGFALGARYSRYDVSGTDALYRSKSYAYGLGGGFVDADLSSWYEGEESLGVPPLFNECFPEPGGERVFWDIDGDALEDAVDLYDLEEVPSQSLRSAFLAPIAASEYHPKMPVLEKRYAFRDPSGGGIEAVYASSALGRRFYRTVAAPPQPSFAHVVPQPGSPTADLEPRWPAEARRLIESVDLRRAVLALPGGIRIRREVDSGDRRQRVRPGARSVHVISKESWTHRSEGYPGDAPRLEWVRGEVRGALDEGKLLGSSRKAQPRDAASWPVPFPWFDDIEQGRSDAYAPVVETQDGRTLLRLVPKRRGVAEIRIAVDPQRAAVLEVAQIQDGKITSRTGYSDFVEIAGRSFPRLIEIDYGESGLTSTTRLAYEELDSDAVERALEGVLSPLADAIVLDLPLPKVSEAKRRAAAGGATLADRWVLLGRFAVTQEWDRVKEHAAAIGELAQGKPGAEWIRLEVLLASGRNDEARSLGLALAARIDKASSVGDFALARQLRDQLWNVVGAAERLDFLDAIELTFERQDERLQPRKEWLGLRRSALSDLGRAEESNAILEELAAAHPDDVWLQTGLADLWVARGEVDRAVAHLEAVRREHGPWTDWEERRLHEYASELLRNARRLVDYLAFVDRWITESPDSVPAQVLDRMLAALVMLDREPEADARIEAWLAGARADDAAALEKARMSAAISHALGVGADLYSSREIDLRWRKPLADVARDFVFRSEDADLGARVLQDWRFRRVETMQVVWTELYGRLCDEADGLPADVVRRVCQWLRNADQSPGKGQASWEDLAKRLLLRWDREGDEQDKEEIAKAILATGAQDATVDLRRRQLAVAGTDEAKAAAAGNLLNALLAAASGKPWSAELERELLALVPQVGEGSGKPVAQIAAVQSILQTAGAALARARIEAIPDRSTKSARELRPLDLEARRKAKEDLVEVIRQIEAFGLDALVVPFVKIERLSLEAGLGLQPARVSAELRSLLLEIPEPKPEDDDSAGGVEADPLDSARAVLAARCALSMGYLATRPDAEASLAAELLKVLEDRIEKAAASEDPGLLDAKHHKYLLLVALDRPDELEQALGSWAQEVGDVPANPWKVPLAYVLAERGKLEAAVTLLESVERIDELGASEYRSLAGWRLALDRKEAQREARIRAYEKTEEWQIAQSLRGDLQLYQREGDGVPGELDEEVLLRFSALIRKAANPESYLSILREYYRATKDFRLLEALPDAVVGQSAGKVYAFLSALGTVLNVVGDEATIDRLVARLRELRGGAVTPVDRRGLTCLELAVEKRAADQAQGAGPHRDSARAALRDAFAVELEAGEAVLAAGFLASLGRVAAGLDEDILDQLRTLYDRAEAETEDRFQIGVDYARSLWANGRSDEAVTVLEAAIDEWRRPRDGRTEPYVDSALETLGAYRENRKEFAAAERLWRREVDTAPNESRRRWAELRLLRSLQHAFQHGGKVSLGSGEELYVGLRSEILGALQRRTDEDHAAQLVGIICATFQAATGKIEDARRDLLDFAYDKLPRVLALYQYRGGQGMVETVREAILGRDLKDWRGVIEFLVTRAESEPRWLERRDDDFWGRHGAWLARARAEAKDLGSFDARTLSVFLKELRRDLRNRNQRSRYGYYARWNHFWREKTDDFRRVALEILDERRDSEPHIVYIAEYLYDGLDRTAEAIDILWKAYRQGSLTGAGRSTLVRLLFRSDRHAEAVPVLVQLVEESPDSVSFRGDLARAYFDAGDRAQALATVAAADARFRKGGEEGESHAKGSVTEDVASTLAEACLHMGSWKGRGVDRELLEKAVAYYDEAIALRTRSAPNRGVGEGTLSSYYGSLAQASSHLGDVARAVDAAAGAIVSWGPRHEQRKAAEAQLLDVLKAAKNLDAYVADFEAELARDGVENPTVRKALGRAHLERKEFAKAAHQLEAAVESGVVDAEMYRAYLDALERGDKPQEATSRLWTLARRMGHDLKLYEELGGRLERAQDDPQADRAYTSLAELSANESEGRAMLAQVRERQERFLEAAEEWRQVTRVRSKEPTGYVGLARSLIGAGRAGEAREVILELRRQGWPERFRDVEKELKDLEARLER